MSIEGTRSYGVGLARAAAATGLTVIECAQPNRKTRRGKGKSDPIDAHLAVLTALALDAEQLPTPRADGDREALRILLGARHDLTTTHSAQTNRLQALLLAGQDTDRQIARAGLTDTVLAALIIDALDNLAEQLAGLRDLLADRDRKRRPPREAHRAHAVRHVELRRPAVAVRDRGTRAHGQPRATAGHRR